MQKQKTKTKISNSLKKHYHRKKIIADCKAMAGFAVLAGTIGILIQLGAPTILANDTARHAFLPKNKDKQEMTNTYKIMVEATKQCNKRNLGGQCINDIMAMSWVESRHNPQAIGDRGGSHGILQLNQYYHPEITQAQAENIKFAIDWTLNRLLHYGYFENRKYAIRKHNGSANNPATLIYFNKVNNYINN